LSDSEYSSPTCSPFLAGCEAFRAGVKVGDNPHDETTEAHWQWMAGWVKAGEQALKAKMANAAGQEAR
jgi:hypothetical protein